MTLRNWVALQTHVRNFAMALSRFVQEGVTGLAYACPQCHHHIIPYEIPPGLVVPTLPVHQSTCL